MNNNQANSTLPNDKIEHKNNHRENPAKKIIIISWNANGLSAHAAELKLYLDNTRTKITEHHMYSGI